MQARGHDVKTTVIVNGAAKASFRNANSVTINYGIESDEANYVGSRSPLSLIHI